MAADKIPTKANEVNHPTIFAKKQFTRLGRRLSGLAVEIHSFGFTGQGNSVAVG
jgi:hypothetical protein